MAHQSIFAMDIGFWFNFSKKQTVLSCQIQLTHAALFKMKICVAAVHLLRSEYLFLKEKILQSECLRNDRRYDQSFVLQIFNEWRLMKDD